MVKVLSRIKRCGVDLSWGGIKSWNGYTQVQTILATRYSDSIWALWQTKGREVHTWLWEAWSCFAQKSELLISSYFPCMCFRIRKRSDSEMSREQALTAVEDKQ